MIEQDTAAPVAPVAEAGGQPADTTQQTQQVEQTPEQQAEEAAKKELTAEQKRIRKLETDVRRLVDARGRARAEAAQLKEMLQQRSIGDTNHSSGDDSETLSLSKADFERMVRERAERLAPDLMRQKSEEEKLVSAARSLHEKVGAERFESMTAELAEVLPRDHQLMLLRAKDPVEVVSYLTDPDNADELEAIGRMDAFDAGQAIGEIRAKLKAARAEAKQQPSKAAAPLEPVRGGGTVNRAPDPKDTKAWIKWANEQERSGAR